MSLTPLSESFTRALGLVLPADRLTLEPATRWTYGYDNSRRHALPGVVVFPQTTAEVANIVRCCVDHNVPLVVHGRGTSTTGSAVAIAGGLVLSTERMNQILAIDPANRTATVQPGVLNQTLQDELSPTHLFWPPDPSSQAFATIGANLALNSAGPLAVKYGAPRENTLALEAVTGNGDIIRTGIGTTKSAIGYDFTRLLIGSEGTLAIITEATLLLTPLPPRRALLSGWYASVEAATEVVAHIMARPIIPCSLEFMDANALQILREQTTLSIPNEARALLLIELDGSAETLESQVTQVATTAKTRGCLQLGTAITAAEQSALWQARKQLSPALRTLSPGKINEDIVVPVAQIPELIRRVDQLSASYGIRIVNFGHAGNGNIHTNLLIDPTQADEARRAKLCLNDLFALVIELGGALSGEHGIGLEKRPYMTLQYGEVELRLMRDIKRVFDPLGILNPGKLIPDPT